ncbi:MAG: hypothetical protein WC985_03250 [Thermoplasmata archaeon]
MSILGRALQRFYSGLEPFGGLRLAKFDDVKNADVLRPTLTWDSDNPPTHSEVNGSVYICTAATSTEDVLWHREAGAWVKVATLSDLLLPAVSDVTITDAAPGVATLTQAAHTIRGFGGAADNCDSLAGMTATEIAFLVTGAEAITYRDATVGAGNISTSGDTSLVTATGDVVLAFLSGTVVRVIPLVMAAGLPAGLNALARGRIIRGSAAGLMEALDLSVADTIPVGNGTDVVGMVLPTTGILAKTAAGATSGRTISVGALASLSVLFGNGVGGNPTIDAIQDIRTTASPTFASLHLNGDLLVEGNSFLGELERVQLEANYICQNLGYSANVAVTGGLAINYFPTATQTTTVGTGVIVAGVPAVSNPTITTAGAATFGASDIILISGAFNDENNGLYEVVSHAANLLTLRSTANGVTPRVEAFTDDQLTANAGDVGITLTKINVAVLRVGVNGLFEVAASSVTGMTFVDIALDSNFVIVPGDVIVTDPGGDLVFPAGIFPCIRARGFGAAADDVITCSGLRNGQSGFVVCGAEAISFVDGATLAVERNATLITAAGDIVKITRHGAVYYVESIFSQAGVPTSTTSQVTTVADHAVTPCTGSAIADHGAIVATTGEINHATGTGFSTAGQVVTTSDNQTLALNECAGMWLITATKAPCLIVSHPACAAAPLVATVFGLAPVTAAEAYRILRAPSVTPPVHGVTQPSTPAFIHGVGNPAHGHNS